MAQARPAGAATGCSTELTGCRTAGSAREAFPWSATRLAPAAAAAAELARKPPTMRSRPGRFISPNINGRPSPFLTGRRLGPILAITRRSSRTPAPASPTGHWLARTLRGPPFATATPPTHRRGRPGRLGIAIATTLWAIDEVVERRGQPEACSSSGVQHHHRSFVEG